LSNNTRLARNPWLGMAFVGVALLVVSLNDTILTTALPVIARDLGASSGQVQWLGDAYILTFAALLLTMGALSDRYGRKLALMLGVILFALCSVLAGFATTTGWLLVARALQGVGAAIILPSTLSLVTTLFRDPHERAHGIAAWSAVFGVGVGIGPVLGGWLAARFHWSSAFFVNLPFAAVALIGGILLLPESRDPDAPRPDVPGVVLSAVGLFALVYALIEAGSHGWHSPRFLLGVGLFLVLLIAFIAWERRIENALLPMWLFRNMSFTAASAAMILTQFTLIGVVFYLPQFMQTVLGFDSWETAIRFIPIGVLAVIVMTQSPRIVRRLGIKWTVAGGFMVAAIGLLLLAELLSPDVPYWLLALLAVIVVLGVDNAMPAATMSIMGAVPPSKAGVGSAMNEMTGQIGGALGIATLGSLMNLTYHRRVAGLEMDVAPDTYARVTHSIFSAHRAAESLPQTIAAEVLSTANEAFATGMAEALGIGAFILLGAAVLTAFLLPGRIQVTVDPKAPVVVPVDAASEKIRVQT
jgi:EmrB/QacA subfamily drug resistance transporter